MYNSDIYISATDAARHASCSLALELLADGFAYAVQDAQGTLLSVGRAHGRHAATMTQVMSDVKGFFASVGIPLVGYSRMTLLVTADAAVWVPKELYDPAAGRSYLRAVGGTATSLLSAESTRLNAVSLFSSDERLVTAFKVALPGIVVTNQHVAMADRLLQRAGKQHATLMLRWDRNGIDMAATKGGHYIFGNRLSFSSKEQAIYLVVEMLRVYGLADEGCEMLLCGDVDRDIFARLQPYFPTASLYTGQHTSLGNAAMKGLHTYRHALIV